MGTQGEPTQFSVPVVCPSCEGVLFVPRGANGGHQTGDTLEVPCSTCGKLIEILAPPGIEAFERGVPDARVVRMASEFVKLESGA